MNGRTIDFIPQYPERRIQIILKFLPSPINILLYFDLDTLGGRASTKIDVKKLRNLIGAPRKTLFRPHPCSIASVISAVCWRKSTVVKLKTPMRWT